jgi:two-component system, NarL family, response regulator NreC
MPKIRIAIADDHDVVRSGLRVLLRTSADFSIVGEAADGEEAVRLAEKTRPDVMLMDISMPNLDGIGATKIIKEKFPEVKVVILTVHEDEEYAYQILRAGASGYVLKNAGKRDIFKAIESAVSGERFFSPGISNIIVEGFIKRAKEQPPREQPPASSSDQPLTKRETEVLKYIALGYTNRQIADTLFLSFRTVNTHRANIMAKLDIHETAGLVRYAISTGLVESSAKGS